MNYTIWGSHGSENGEFFRPHGIAIDENYLYVVDRGNGRIQKFDSEGKFISSWGTPGHEDGQFWEPYALALDASGNVYVADTNNYRIQKFSSDGEFIRKWGSKGSGDGEFEWPVGIAISGNEEIYVVDSINRCIQKFDTNGDFLERWENNDTGVGYFDNPVGIAIDSSENVYVTDASNNCVKKFSSDGNFLISWGEIGRGNRQFIWPEGIVADEYDNVYIADKGNARIQKFDMNGQYITEFGKAGFDQGRFSGPSYVCVSREDNVYVSDPHQNRIQVFNGNGNGNGCPPPCNKAVIVAGGGPHPGNNIWNATQMCVNYAYHALTYQGYTKETIFYMSHITDVNSGENNYYEIDSSVTNDNLQFAITEWAKDAEKLVIFMVDHGGDKKFRMSATEVLDAEELNKWLDKIQETVTGEVILVYDACHSGSFIKQLDPPVQKQRILMTSTSPDEEALFAGRGTLSFNYLFWSHIFNGDSFYDSFVYAKQGIQLVYSQIPQLEADGNGIPDERSDYDIASLIKLGDEKKTGNDIPFIGSVSSVQTLNGETSAQIYAENVIDANGISRVWAVITPPGCSTASPHNPFTKLPEIDLILAEDDKYEGIYDNFNMSGTYRITVFATDKKGLMSLPEQIIVIQTSENRDSKWVKIYGRVLYDRVPLCAMVLANGEYTFSSAEDGKYELNVPLNENGEISLLAFCDGFAPFKQILKPCEAIDVDINMFLCEECPEMSISIHKLEPIIEKPGWIKITGSVSDENGTGLCVMVLANGQHIFSCGEPIGYFELDAPFNENGEIILFGFADGFQPFKETLRYDK